jgi:hypothetical protein
MCTCDFHVSVFGESSYSFSPIRHPPSSSSSSHLSLVLNTLIIIFFLNDTNQTKPSASKEAIVFVVSPPEPMRIYFVIALSGLLPTACSFGVTAPITSRHDCTLVVHTTTSSRLFSTTDPDADDPTNMNTNTTPMTKQDKKALVGNLVADDEWEGLGMELSELVRTAVIEDLKKNARDFLGKDGYKIGDIR